MILVLVFVGFLVGGGAAAVALVGGAGLIAALTAYSAFGALAVAMTAAVVALGPLLHRRPEPHSVPAMPRARYVPAPLEAKVAPRHLPAPMTLAPAEAGRRYGAGPFPVT